MAWWVSSDARGLEPFLAELRQCLANIQRFPRSGRPVNDAGDSERRVVRVGPYLLFYVVKEETVHLVLLQHVRRRPEGPDLTLLR